jgi:hypothetical protein
VIAFGCSITQPKTYASMAEPGIRLAAEPDSLVLAHAAAGPLSRSYNLMLDRVRDRDDLEALVLLHQDAEIADPDFCAKLRAALSDPAVGVVGCVGAVGATSIAWWEGSVTWDAFARCYGEMKGAPMPDLSWNGEKLPPNAPMGEVHTLDGFMLALSPWAVRELRFDESLDFLHGVDFDFCMQVLDAGRKVVAADLDVIHHHPLELVTKPQAWLEAHMLVSEKWTGRMPHVDEAEIDWKRRARQSEAEAGVARLAGASKLLMAYARAEQHDSDEHAVTQTASWRITEPLRRANAIRKARREPDA